MSPGVAVSPSGADGTIGGGGHSAGNVSWPLSNGSIVSRRTASHFAMVSGVPSSTVGHGSCPDGLSAVSTTASGPTETRVSPVPVLTTFTNGVVAPSNDCSTMYSVIGEPPSDVGGDHRKLTIVSPGVAVSPSGADGSVSTDDGSGGHSCASEVTSVPFAQIRSIVKWPMSSEPPDDIVTEGAGGSRG